MGRPFARNRRPEPIERAGDTAPEGGDGRLEESGDPGQREVLDVDEEEEGAIAPGESVEGEIKLATGLPPLV